MSLEIYDMKVFRYRGVEIVNGDVPMGMLGFDCGCDSMTYGTVASCDYY